MVKLTVGTTATVRVPVYVKFETVGFKLVSAEAVSSFHAIFIFPSPAIVIDGSIPEFLLFMTQPFQKNVI
jgi:hypothetical protein